MPCLYHPNITAPTHFHVPSFCMTWCRTSCLADQYIMHPWTDRVISTYACTYTIKTCQWSNLCLLISTVDPYIILLPLLFEFYTSCWNIPAFSSYIPQPLTTDISHLTSEADACCHTSNRYASCAPSVKLDMGAKSNFMTGPALDMQLM